LYIVKINKKIKKVSQKEEIYQISKHQ